LGYGDITILGNRDGTLNVDVLRSVNGAVHENINLLLCHEGLVVVDRNLLLLVLNLGNWDINLSLERNGLRNSDLARNGNLALDRDTLGNGD
jgi:hypothetical protein